MSNPYSFPEKSFFKRMAGAVKTIGCKYNWYTTQRPSQDQWLSDALSELRNEGIVILENYLPADTLQSLQTQNDAALRSGRFNWPVVSESKIPANYFEEATATGELVNFDSLKEKGVLVSKSTATFNYDNFISEVRPHLLKVTLDKFSDDFLKLWLDERLLHLVSSYLDCIPKLTEAYVRRSFPSRYPFQNNNWHRDTNHKSRLVKVFFLISEMTPTNGPFQYIRRTCRDFSICNNAEYYNDPKSLINDYERRLTPKRIPAGSVIVADTRGLHRASLPISEQRDLGYAVFFPVFFGSPMKQFSVDKAKYERLNKFQKKFILSSVISQNENQKFEYSI